MIRDPSDGSVRNPHGESPLSREVVPTREPRAPDSGLPDASTKPERQARLERSREWLKQYHAKKSE